MPTHEFVGDSPSHGTTDDAAAAARRARKREQDRRSQRRSRQRTKSRIAQLEELNAELQQKHPDDKYMALRRERDELSAARAAMAATLDAIDQALQAHRAMNPTPHDASLPTTEELGGENMLTPIPDRTDHPQIATPPVTSTTRNDSDLGFLSPTRWSPSSPGQQTTDRIFQSSLAGDAECIDPIIPSATGESCDCSPVSSYTAPRPGSLNLWRFANETLAEPAECSDHDNRREDELEDDIPVRAILEGWDAVQRLVGKDLPPSWQKLRLIDQTLFSKCGRTERLAILTTMHSLYRYHQTHSPQRREIPIWYLARPSQSMAHSYAIDYFAWPGIRERFVFSQHKYCGNLFWKVFSSEFHILWPFEFRDCYSLNVATQEYKISHAFSETIKDIRSWTMSSGMFERWPEFLSDIPTYNSIPPSLQNQAPELPVFPVNDWDFQYLFAGCSGDQEEAADVTNRGNDEPRISSNKFLANSGHHLRVDLNTEDLLAFEGSGSLLFCNKVPVEPAELDHM